jgi:diguanylate cyclase (GGDEF)-like protein
MVIKMKAFYKYLDTIPKTLILGLGALLVILIGVVDHLTGYEIAFSIFYLLPVALVSWFGNRNHALMISVLSAATWLLADLTAGHIYSHPAIPVWNAMMRFGFFLMGTLSLSTIRELLERAQTFARIDYLTGVSNSRAFNEIAKIEIERSVRYGHPFTMAYIDIDNFKQVNDTLGHDQGDNLLQSIAKTMKENMRSTDIVARLGGDEFAILLPETNEENAKSSMDKLQRHLIEIVVKKNNWPITFSIGVVTCYKSCNLDELIKEVDDLMYSAKESGKNKIKFKLHDTSTNTHNESLRRMHHDTRPTREVQQDDKKRDE